MCICMYIVMIRQLILSAIFNCYTIVISGLHMSKKMYSRYQNGAT